MLIDESQLLGEWVQTRPNPAPVSIFILFEPQGRLIYKMEGSGDLTFALTWRLEGDHLITTQPDGPEVSATVWFAAPSILVVEREEETYRYERC